MSILSELDRISQNIKNAYAAAKALGADMPSDENSDNLTPTILSSKPVLYAPQTLTAPQQAQARQNIGAIAEYNVPWVSVIDYGAVGDGATDDTEAFRAALAANRGVFVPGGTYKLSGTLVIRENCCLELSQDTVLNFTQTNTNCIELTRLANLVGNHATIFVPYTFSANVIHASTDVDSAGGNNSNVPPFTTWDPQWKMSRYVTDINICKRDSRGFHYSVDGDCYGTAVYIKCNVSDPINFMWGVDMSGIRIAGGFTYGIRIRNIGDTMACWNHDMRIEAVIDACETGVSVENCHMLHLAASVQPRRAYSMSEVYSNYAKYGIKLVDSHNVDLSQSYVWDWQLASTASKEYTHIAMYGNCYGAILYEPRYYESSVDVRESIYTDTPSNLEKMTILQEPITRYFRPIENKPYFHNGDENKRLLLWDEFNDTFQTDYVKQFTDVLATAQDANGNIYKGVGYLKGGIMNTNGSETIGGNYAWYVTTGYIPFTPGNVFYMGNISFDHYDGNCGVRYYDANHNSLFTNTVAAMLSSSYYHTFERTDSGMNFTAKTTLKEWGAVAYIQFVFHISDFGANPAIAINEEIKYTQEGFLADGVKVKGDNILVYSPGGQAFKLTINDSGVLTPVKLES